MTEDRLTIVDAAAYLMVSRRTLYRLIADRRVSVVKIRSRSFIRRSELDRFLRASEPGRAA